jgi:hypothetical protein
VNAVSWHDSKNTIGFIKAGMATTWEVTQDGIVSKQMCLFFIRAGGLVGGVGRLIAIKKWCINLTGQSDFRKKVSENG